MNGIGAVPNLGKNEIPGATIDRVIRNAVPLSMNTVTLGGNPVGLVIVDEVNGFVTVGAGNLAPPAPDCIHFLTEQQTCIRTQTI